MSATTDNTELKELNDIAKEKQNKLTYYTENEDGSVDLYPKSHFVLDGGGNVSITSGIDFEVNVPQGDVIIESRDGVFVNTDDKFEYNDSEVATVKDLDGYATTSDLSDKQDKLKYYSEGTNTATISASSKVNLYSNNDINIEASDGGVITIQSTDSNIDIYAPKGAITVETDSFEVLNSNNSGFGINSNNINIWTTDNSKAVYNGNEIATVSDLSDKQDKLKFYSESSNDALISGANGIDAIVADYISLQGSEVNLQSKVEMSSSSTTTNQISISDSILIHTRIGDVSIKTADGYKATYNGDEIATVDSDLESYREKYKDTLIDNIASCFDTKISLEDAKIMDVSKDLNSCRIRLLHLDGYHRSYGFYITWSSVVVAVSSYNSNYDGTGYSSCDLIFSIDDSGNIVFPSGIYTLNEITSY